VSDSKELKLKRYATTATNLGILGNIIQRYGAENATTDSVLIIYTHMSSLKTSGLVMVEHLVTTAIVMKVCLIKEQFSK
jgi:hypothetical protein